MSNLDNSKPNKILGVISIILGKVWRLFWNSLTSLLTLFLLAFLAYFAVGNFNTAIEYNKYGKTTTATIDRLYKNKQYPFSKSNELDYFMDFSFTADGKVYKKEGYLISHDGRYKTGKYINIPSENLEVGNKLDILYHEYSPMRSFVLEDKDPRDPAMLLIFVALITTLFFMLFVNLFAWNPIYGCYCGAIVFPILLLIVLFYIYYSYPSVTYWNKPLLFGGFMLIVIGCILSERCLRIYYRGTQAIATITNTALSVGTGRGLNPFMGIYEYEYEDASGKSHFGECRDLFFLNKSIKIGQKINIMYSPKKPQNHLRVGLA